MIENVGEKIKKWSYVFSKICFVCGIIFVVMMAIFMLDENDEGMAIGLAGLFYCPFGYFSSLLLYGFGIIVENMENLKYMLDKKDE